MDGGGYDFTRVTGSNNLIGAWTFGDSLNPDANGTGVIVFMENLVYFHIETDNTDVDGMNGMERGTYTWNQITGAFSSTQAVDTNGQWGLSDTYSGMLVSVTGNTLNATDTDGPGSGTFSASRVSAVPEPSTYAVMAGALVLGIAILRRRI